MKTTQNLMRVKELLLTPPTFSDNKARLQTNRVCEEISVKAALL